jgi:hypothetical protein
VAAPVSSRAQAVGGDRLRRMCTIMASLMLLMILEWQWMVASVLHRVIIVTGYCGVP